MKGLIMRGAAVLVATLGTLALGTGAASASSLDGAQESSPHSLVNVAPVVPVNVCGVGIGLLGIGSAANCDTNQTIEAPSNDGALVNVAPVVPVNVCGVGVGVLGIGSAANCDTNQTVESPDNSGWGGLVNVAPVVPVNVCGVGVGLLGIGSAANCDTMQSVAPGSGSGGLVDVSPVVPVNACGVGIGVLGVGTSASCTTDQTTGNAGGETPGPVSDNPGSSSGGSGEPIVEAAFAAVSDAVASPLALAGATPALAFTGGLSMWILGLAVMMLVIGGGFQGVSRFWFQGLSSLSRTWAMLRP